MKNVNTENRLNENRLNKLSEELSEDLSIINQIRWTNNNYDIWKEEERGDIKISIRKDHLWMILNKAESDGKFLSVIEEECQDLKESSENLKKNIQISEDYIKILLYILIIKIFFIILLLIKLNKKNNKKNNGTR